MCLRLFSSELGGGPLLSKESCTAIFAALVLTSSYKKTVEHHQRAAEAAAAEQGSVGPSKASTFEQKLANLDKAR